MLPKFLIADNSQDSPDDIYVVHTQYPKCIFKCDIDETFADNFIIHWLEEEPNEDYNLKGLIAEADQFIEDELDNQENLFDKELDEIDE